MFSLARNSRLGGVVLAGALGMVAVMAAPAPAHADGWIQFGIVAPTVTPPPVIVAPPPPPQTYGYVYSYPYAYASPYAYYAAPSYGYGDPVYIQDRDGWRHRHWRDRDERDDDD